MAPSLSFSTCSNPAGGLLMIGFQEKKLKHGFYVKTGLDQNGCHLSQLADKNGQDCYHCLKTEFSPRAGFKAIW